MSLAAVYKADILGNVHGGQRRGLRYLDNVDLQLDLDLERTVGLRHTRAHFYALYNNGTQFSSSLVGDAQVVSNIETGTRALRLYEAWIEHGDDAFNIRAGLYDLNSEFDALDSATLFLNSAHGVGTDISQTGENGPSIFPVTAPGVRIQYTPSSSFTMRAAVFNGTAGDPARPARTVFRINGRDGVLLIGELDWRPGAARIVAGTWRYTAPFATLMSGANGSTHGNSGYYLRGEGRLAGAEDGQRLNGFVRVGIASGRFNQFDRFASAGLNLTGVFDRALRDSLGVAVAHARTSGEARVADPLLARSETAFELTYRFRLHERIAVQPDVQYIVNPSATRGTRNAVVLGLRTELALLP